MLKHALPSGNIIDINWQYTRSKKSVATQCTVKVIVNGVVDNEVVNSVRTMHGDNFIKEVGRKLSLAKCLKATVLTKEEKRSIWETYRFSAKNRRW